MAVAVVGAGIEDEVRRDRYPVALVRWLHQHAHMYELRVVCDRVARGRLPPGSRHQRVIRSNAEFLGVSGALARLADRVPGRGGRWALQDAELIHYPMSLIRPRAHVPAVVTVADPTVGGDWRTIADDARAVIVSSEFARDALLERVKLDVDRVSVIAPPIAHDRLTEPSLDDDAAIRRLGLPRRFIYLPLDGRHDNLKVVCQALAGLRDSMLRVLVSESAVRRLGAFADAANVRGRIQPINDRSVPSRALLMRHAQATLFATTSLGFHERPLEALACGSPLVTTDRGAIGELVGDAALKADPTSVDAIVAALEQALGPDRDRLRSAGPARAARHRWDLAGPAHLDVYARALGG